MEVLRFGYWIPFLVTPVFSNVPITLPSYSPSSIRGLALNAAVADLSAKGAIEPAPPSPGYYSCLFVTPKVTGGWQPVIDLSPLSRSVLVSHFHMETQQTVLQSLRPGDWLVCLDLQDAYLKVPVHLTSRRYLRFCVGDAVYQFCALCFGLSTAPQTFTRVMAPISSIMHSFVFRILRYLDDWLVLGSSFREIVRARDFLLWLCHELPDTFTDPGLSGDEASDASFEGFPEPQTCPEALMSLLRVCLLSSSTSVSLASAARGNVVAVDDCSGVPASDTIPSAPTEFCRPSPSGLRHCVLGHLLPHGSPVMVR